MTATKRTIRYGIVGLGHIAQVAVIPAFAHARRNSQLAAIVSSDRTKRREIARRYRIDQTFTYEEFDGCLRAVDAVKIALPNSMHAEYAIRAARAGVHVLCEKPMAVTVDECRQMIAASRKAEGQADDRVSAATFARSRTYGGGTLYDIGVYCINAARNLFRAEPTQVSAVSVNSGLATLSEIDETTAATLRFGNDRVATFITSFNAADVASYRIVGTKGHLHADPAYEYAEGLEYALTIGGRRLGRRSGNATSLRRNCCIFRIVSSMIESQSRRVKRACRT